MSTLPLFYRRFGYLGPSTNRLVFFYGIIYSFSQVSALKMLAVDYEVHGRVQGVFFRKYTQAKAKELGIVGWVRNTSQGTVVGQLEGEKAKVSDMKNWLQTIGSPHSKIEKCEFKNEREIPKLTFSNFLIKS